MNESVKLSIVTSSRMMLIAAGLVLSLQSGAPDSHAAEAINDGATAGIVASKSINVPRIDEIAYWRQVKRMSLDGEARTQALRLKPKFRADVLSGRLAIDQLPYSKTDRSIDEKWIQAHQQMERDFQQQADQTISVAGYDINQFVGYRCGKNNWNAYDDDGICYKVYFDFKDAARDLSPQLYFEFMQKLDKAGFIGDSKVSMTPGSIRFFYNNIIVHTGTPESAKLAEQIGLAFFGSRLEYYATGVDVQQTKRTVDRGPVLARGAGINDKHPRREILLPNLKPATRWSNPIDWHHYLSETDDLSRLSPRALQFVECAAKSSG
jgi:hypothetical protein